MGCVIGHRVPTDHLNLRSTATVLPNQGSLEYGRTGKLMRVKRFAEMRKVSLIFLGAIAGAGLTLLVTHPSAVGVGSSAEAALSDTYKQLTLFGEVFERVRADYVEKPDDSKLVQSAINGMLAGLDPHHGSK